MSSIRATAQAVDRLGLSVTVRVASGIRCTHTSHKAQILQARKQRGSYLPSDLAIAILRTNSVSLCEAYVFHPLRARKEENLGVRRVGISPPTPISIHIYLETNLSLWI